MNFRLSIALLTVGCASGTLSAADSYGSMPYVHEVSAQNADQAVNLGLRADQAPAPGLVPVANQQANPEPDTWVLAVIGFGLILASALMRRKTSAAYKRIGRG